MAWLEVHVFGSNSKGEGIVLKLPDGKYAVVDSCFVGDIQSPQNNPIVQFLRDNNVSVLAFACLTHPHEDHYFGFSQILSEFPPALFFRSAAMQPENLVRIVYAEKAQALSLRSVRLKRAANELHTIHNVLVDLAKQKKCAEFWQRCPFTLNRFQKMHLFNHRAVTI